MKAIARHTDRVATELPNVSGPDIGPAIEHPVEAVVHQGIQLDDESRQIERAHSQLMGRGYVQYFPALTEVAGDYKGALMLGHALHLTRYWHERYPQRGGWFFKTATEWTQSVGLSSREQERVRQTLLKAKVWEEKVSEWLCGAPARLHCRIDLAALADKLHIGSTTDLLSNTASLLSRPVLYFRSLADLAGGAANGLLLSELLDAQRTAMVERRADAQGYHEVHFEQIRARLNLGPKVMRNARDGLKRSGLLMEAITQERKPRLLARVNLSAIMACMSGQPAVPWAKTAPEPLARPAVHPRPNRALVVREEGNVTSVMRTLEAGRRINTGRLLVNRTGTQLSVPQHHSETHDDGGNRQCQESASFANQQLSEGEGCRFVESTPEPCRFVESGSAVLSNQPSTDAVLLNQGLPFCRIPIHKGNYIKQLPREREDRAVDNSEASRRRRDKDTSQEPIRTEPVDSAPPALADARLDSTPDLATDLVFPKPLADHHHDAAKVLLRKVSPTQQQELLDELAGNLENSRTPIRNPIGYLQKLVAHAQAGTLVLSLAPEVAERRQRQQRAQQAVPQAITAVAPATQVEVSTPESQAAAAAARAKLLEQSRLLRARHAGKVLLPNSEAETESGGAA